MFAPPCPTRLARNGRQFSSLFLLSIINLIIILTLWSQNAPRVQGVRDIRSVSDVENATNPLIYKRLRFDDDFNQVYRRFQKNLTIDETKVTLEVNQTQADNKTRPVKYTYYENNKVEATSFTQDDIIFEALDQAYLTRLIPAHLFTYDNKRDMAESSDPNLVSERNCDRELNFLMGHLSTLQNVRLSGAKSGIQLNNNFSVDVLAFFDAFGSEEPGLLLGNYVWSGYWRQCYRSLIFSLDKAQPENTLEFESRYCVASIRSRRWDKLAAKRIPELERQRHFKYPEQKYDYARFHRIQVGLCLPRSCDSNLINRRLDDVRRLATHKLSEPMRSYEMTDLFCLPDESSKLRQLDTSAKLFLIFFTLWSAVIIWATYYDKQVGLGDKLKGPARPTGFIEKMVDSMSFLRNYERLTETKSLQPKPPIQQATSTDVKQQAGKVKLITERNKPAATDLVFMNCLKVVATLSIIVGHGGMMIKHLDRFVLDYDIFNTPLTHFIFSTIFFVDWYFVITGFITTYIMFLTKRVERNTLRDWIHTVVHRYLRLAPLYLLIFWFAKSVVKHTGHGPLWDYGTNNMTFRSICQRESFITPLTLTSNFHPIHEECVMPSWYIACDFQFYLLTPFLLILLHKSPSTGWLTTLGMIGSCIALRLHRYLTDTRAKHLDLMRPRYDLYMRNNWDVHPTYIYPHYRIASYLIGILAGHYAYMVLSGQWQSPLYYDRTPGGGGKARSSKEEASVKRRKDILRFLAWASGLTTVVMMSFVTGLIFYFPPDLEPYVKLAASITYAVSHSSTSLAMSLFLITTMFGQFDWLKRAMALPIWTLISRVGFVVFMGQIEVLYWLQLSEDRLYELNALELTKSVISICCIIYLIATLLTLMFELPIAQLERNFVAPLFQSSSGSARQPPEVALLAPSTPKPTRRNKSAATQVSAT